MEKGAGKALHTELLAFVLSVLGEFGLWERVNLDCRLLGIIAAADWKRLSRFTELSENDLSSVNEDIDKLGVPGNGLLAGSIYADPCFR